MPNITKISAVATYVAKIYNGYTYTNSITCLTCVSFLSNDYTTLVTSLCNDYNQWCYNHNYATPKQLHIYVIPVHDILAT